jgi:hypothetical protein
VSKDHRLIQRAWYYTEVFADPKDEHTVYVLNVTALKSIDGYVLESPHEQGVIWTGSDDGLVHLTRDGGKSWNNVTPKGLEESLINSLEVSPHDKATAYIAATRYKFNDFSPALYKTTNYGQSWTKISDGIPYGAFTRVVREDDQRKGEIIPGLLRATGFRTIITASATGRSGYFFVMHLNKHSRAKSNYLSLGGDNKAKLLFLPIRLCNGTNRAGSGLLNNSLQDSVIP